VGFSTIQLAWTDNASNELGFRIERALGAKGAFMLLAQVGANLTVYADASVNAGTSYRYRVQAYNAAGASAWSNVITIRAARR
jgi:fibronectin type 3 domain-containing protein